MTNEEIYSQFEEQAKAIEDHRLQIEKQIAVLTNELKGLELQSKAFRVAMEALAPGCVFAAPEGPTEADYAPKMRGYLNAELAQLHRGWGNHSLADHYAEMAESEG